MSAKTDKYCPYCGEKLNEGAHSAYWCKMCDALIHRWEACEESEVLDIRKAKAERDATQPPLIQRRAE